jgi:hypothetical protein
MPAIRNTKNKRKNIRKQYTIKGDMKKASKISVPMMKDALITEDTVYRYWLSRIWNEDKPRIIFIMLNPSTADHMIDDPTIKRVIQFSMDWGYGGVYVVNLYAYRSTKPKGLETTSDPVGPENRKHILTLIQNKELKVDRVVYAWGNGEKEPDWLREIVKEPFCIALSKKGIPRHPLYLKGDLQPTIYVRESCSEE